jgi:protein-S-isoprenylcysteine O-methyltransferase Ste14
MTVARMRPASLLITGAFSAAALIAASTAVGELHTAVNVPSLDAWALSTHAVLKTAALAIFAFFTIGRADAIRKTREPLAFAACALALGGFALLHEPARHVSTTAVVVGDLIAVIFGAWLVAAAARLGRCFSVLPEARGLVRTGPYAIVRHPVYLGEIGVAVGLVIAAPSLWNMIAGGTFLVAQLLRMRLEERALERAFAEYADYARSTPRLIPAVHRRRREVASPRTPSMTLQRLEQE